MAPASPKPGGLASGRASGHKTIASLSREFTTIAIWKNGGRKLNKYYHSSNIYHLCGSKAILNVFLNAELWSCQ